MRKIRSFFIGILLIVIMFAMVVCVALLYRANDQLSIKSYFFQMDNYSANRVGALQNLNDMSAIELRNKLIKKYVSEYFTVIPGETNVENRSVLKNLSDANAYNQWQSGEAQKIAKMSAKKMFRRVYVSDADIAAVDLPEGYDYYDVASAEYILYSVHYTTQTWAESNAMWVEPTYETGNIYIEARFKPGINKNIDIKKYLESGENPSGLFMFEVTNVNSGENE